MVVVLSILYKVDINPTAPQFFISLLDQNVPHSFNMLVTIVRTTSRLISTGIWVIKQSSGPKPEPWIRGPAVVLIITKNADSYLTMSS